MTLYFLIFKSNGSISLNLWQALLNGVSSCRCKAWNQLKKMEWDPHVSTFSINNIYHLKKQWSCAARHKRVRYTAKSYPLKSPMHDVTKSCSTIRWAHTKEEETCWTGFDADKGLMQVGPTCSTITLTTRDITHSLRSVRWRKCG